MMHESAEPFVAELSVEPSEEDQFMPYKIDAG